MSHATPIVLNSVKAGSTPELALGATLEVTRKYVTPDLSLLEDFGVSAESPSVEAASFYFPHTAYCFK